MSLIQHLSNEDEGIDHQVPVISNTSMRSVAPLPSQYTNVPPAALKTKQFIAPPAYGPIQVSDLAVQASKKEEYEWLNVVAAAMKKDELDKNEWLSWSSYYAEKQKTSIPPPAIISLLPLFYENAHSVAMIRHSMNMIQAAVHHLNAGQVPVIAVAQPLYAIAKQIQWTWPDSHGESKFVIMFGGLHIEMTILKVYVFIVIVLCFLIAPHDLTYMFISGFLLQLLGEWLEESGWTKALVQASIATTGTAESFVKVSHVTKIRHAHQITAASLWNLLQQAYDQSDLHTTMSLDEWCHQQAQRSVHFDYWLKTLSLQINKGYCLLSP